MRRALFHKRNQSPGTGSMLKEESKSSPLYQRQNHSDTHRFLQHHATRTPSLLRLKPPPSAAESPLQRKKSLTSLKESWTSRVLINDDSDSENLKLDKVSGNSSGSDSDPEEAALSQVESNQESNQDSVQESLQESESESLKTSDSSSEAGSDSQVETVESDSELDLNESLAQHQDSVADDADSLTESNQPATELSESELLRLRFESQKRLARRWDRIIAHYEDMQRFEGQYDIVDLRTEELVVDRGFLRGLPDADDLLGDDREMGRQKERKHTKPKKKMKKIVVGKQRGNGEDVGSDGVGGTPASQRKRRRGTGFYKAKKQHYYYVTDSELEDSEEQNDLWLKGRVWLTDSEGEGQQSSTKPKDSTTVGQQASEKEDNESQPSEESDDNEEQQSDEIHHDESQESDEEGSQQLEETLEPSHHAARSQTLSASDDEARQHSESHESCDDETSIDSDPEESCSNLKETGSEPEDDPAPNPTMTPTVSRTLQRPESVPKVKINNLDALSQWLSTPPAFLTSNKDKREPPSESKGTPITPSLKRTRDEGPDPTESPSFCIQQQHIKQKLMSDVHPQRGSSPLVHSDKENSVKRPVSQPPIPAHLMKPTASKPGQCPLASTPRKKSSPNRPPYMPAVPIIEDDD